jgi:hypothetical protein
MEKRLLIVLLIVVLLFTGCIKKEENQEINITGANVEQEQNKYLDYLNKSFEERTKEAKDFMNQGNNLSLEGLLKERFVSHALLEKEDNYYVMKLQFSSPKLYNKQEIDNAYELAQQKGEYTFENYTFTKNSDNLISFTTTDSEYNESQKQYLEDLKQNMILADSNKGIVRFESVPNDSTKYCVVEVQFAGLSENVVMDIEKELEVVLLPEDKMKVRLNYDEKVLPELTVEEFYNKAMDKEKIEFDGYSDFEILDLSNIGDSRDGYSTYQNAVEFNDVVTINYTIGGI